MNGVEEIVKKAESCLKKKGWFSSPKYDEAADLYVKAGNMYKVNQNWTDSFGCFLKAAEIYQKTGDVFEAASKYRMAANAVKNKDAEKAVLYIQKASEMYFESGRLGMAARNTKETAEMYEKLLKDTIQAAAYYEKAAEMYSADESPAMCTGAILSAAFLHAKNEEYEKAARGFDKAAFYYDGMTSTKSIARGYFFNAGLCHLCFNDIVESRRIIQKYSNETEAFDGSKEKEFLEKITTDIEEEDLDSFVKSVEKHDGLMYFDEWKRNVLEKIKDRIECTSLM